MCKKRYFYIPPVFVFCMIKWILFDFGNVIVNHVFEGKDKYWLNGNVFPGPDMELIYSLPEYKEFSKGNLTEKEFITKFLEISELNLTISDLIQIYEKDISITLGMRDLLESLHTNYSLAILTNEGKEWADRKIDILGIRRLFDEIITSADLHKLKPEKDFYIKALGIINSNPEECLFIDDLARNCEVAESLGIRSICFSNVEKLKKDLNPFLVDLS